jgi:hypothetical protein
VDQVRALICIDGIYDIGQAYTGRLGLGVDTERRLTDDTDPDLDAALQRLMHTSSQVRWAFRQGMWSFGVRTPRAYLAASLAPPARTVGRRRPPRGGRQPPPLEDL